MSEIVAYLPTYSPETEASPHFSRPYTRLTNKEISDRVGSGKGKVKPWLYMDAIDSILNVRPDIKLVVGDGRSTDSMRDALLKHHKESHLETCEATHLRQTPIPPEYKLELYPEKMSQWAIFNDIMEKHTTTDTKYFVYSSSDVIWQMDWVGEAIKEFERDPKIQVLFPYVNNGDINLPCQISDGPRDMDSFAPPYQVAGRARVLNAYAMIFRMDFLRTYGGYPTFFRNCFTESFLYYMCEAIGGELRVLPRGWCYHYGTGDMWKGEGSAYYYNEEKLTFDQVMNNVLMHKAMGTMNVGLFKKILYK